VKKITTKQQQQCSFHFT